MSTESEVEDYAQSVFENKNVTSRACVFCAGIHDQVAGLQDYYQPCPRVKRLVRNEVGDLLEIEFWRPGTWERNVVFPSDVYPEDED